MTWQIVAFITLIVSGSEITEVVSMNTLFETRQECKVFVESNDSVLEDLDIMYPTSESYKILCMPESYIQDMLKSPIKTIKNPQPA